MFVVAAIPAHIGKHKWPPGFFHVLISCFFVSFIGFKFVNPARSISFTSKGPTAGLLSVSEEKPAAADEKVEQNENNEVTPDGEVFHQ